MTPIIKIILIYVKIRSSQKPYLFYWNNNNKSMKTGQKLRFLNKLALHALVKWKKQWQK